MTKEILLIIRTLLVSVTFAAAAACGTPGTSAQSATVNMGDRDCEVNPVALKVGDVTFTVRNTTSSGALFQVTEDEGTEVVGQANVEPGSATQVKVHLDAADVYQVHCGTVTGPEISPGAPGSAPR